MWFHELYKLFSSKKLMALLAIFVGFNLLFLSQQKIHPTLENKNVLAVQAEIADKNLNEKVTYLNEKVQALNAYLALQMGGINTDFLANENDTAEIYAPYVGAFQKGDYLKFYNNIPMELALYQFVYDEVKTVRDYPQYVDNITKQAEIMQKNPLFNRNKGFTFYNIIATPPAYAHLQGNTITHDVGYGVGFATNNPVADVLGLGLILFAVLVLVHDEKQKKTVLLTGATRSGRGKLFVAKCVALSLWAAVVVALVFFSSVVFCAVVYGAGDLGRAIQSVSPFYGSVLDVTVWQYLLIHALVKWFALLTAGLVMTCFALWLSNSSAVILAVVGFFGAFAALYHAIDTTSVYSVLKTLNPYAMLDVFAWLKTYQNMNFFGKPVSMYMVIMVFAVVLFGLSFALGILMYRSQKFTAHQSGAIADFILKHNPLRKRTHTNLFAHQAQMLLVRHKGTLAVLVFVATCFYQYHTYAPEIDPNAALYKGYMVKIGGEVTAHTTQFIAEEVARIDSALQSNGAQLAQEKESKNTAYYEAVRNSDLLKRQRDVLAQIDTQVAEILSTKSKAHLIYQAGYLELMGGNHANDMLYSGLLGFFAVILLAPLYAVDRQTGAFALVSATKNGRRKLWRTNLVLSGACVALMSAVAQVPLLLNVAKFYGTAHSHAPVQSVQVLAHFPLEIPISTYLVLLFVLRMLASVLIAWIVLLFSYGIQHLIGAMFAGFAVFVLPNLLFLFGATAMAKVGIAPVLGVNAVLTSGLWSTTFASLVLVIVAIIFLRTKTPMEK